MDFQVGDKVIHTSYGLVEIVDLEKKEVAGTVTLFYVVKAKDMTVWIPVHTEDRASLRPPATRPEFEKFFSILRDRYNPFSENRMERKAQIHTRLQEGNSGSVCRLVRDLSFYRRNKKLNEYETSIFERTVTSLVDEWQYSLAVPPAKARSDLTQLLDESYTKSMP
jgi:RNA polymerase-interacting CarD/CdnL/TRCF family regulator